MRSEALLRRGARPAARPAPNFLDQVFAEQLAYYFAGRAALQFRAKFNGAILALRGGGKQHQLRVGEFNRAPPFGWQQRLAPSPPKPRSVYQAGGQDPRTVARWTGPDQ